MEIREIRGRILEQVFAILADTGSGPLLPFALAQTGDRFKTFTVVSGSAMVMARRTLKSRANDATAYAIAVEAVMSVDGGAPTDVILVEAGDRVTAQVSVHPYAREPVRWVGEPVPAEADRPSALTFDPFALEWCASTPDRYRREDNHAIHIVNHALEQPDAIARTHRFLRGRIVQFVRNMPATPPAIQTVMVDGRGQTIDRPAVEAGLSDVAHVRWID